MRKTGTFRPSRVVLALVAALNAYACSDDGVTGVLPARVAVEPSSSFLPLGQTSRLTATVLGSDDEPLAGHTVTWASLNPLVAEVDPAGNVTGRRTGTATIRATAGGVSGTATVTVISGPAVQIVADTVYFQGVAGGASPGDHALAVVNAGEGTLSALGVTIRYVAGQPAGWLHAELSASTAPATLLLRASQAGLPTGEHQAIVRISSPLAGNADSVLVRFTVTAPLPAIALGATTVTFTTAQNDADPSAQPVAITNAGGGTLSGLGATITYPAGQPAGWLTTELAASTAPTTLLLRASSAGLPQGSYTATVAITSPVAQNSPRTIAVSMEVGPALPVLTVQPGALAFSVPQGQPAPPAQTVEITNTGGGAVSNLSASITHPAGQPSGWLSVDLGGTTAPATATVTADPGGLAPGTYTATLTISSPTAANAPQPVTVVLVVQAPLPPSAPTGLSANPVSTSRIDLAWNAATGVVSRYRIERATGAGAFAAIDSVTAAVLSYASTGLAAGTLYRYRVQACNAAACSAHSIEASATTAALPAIALSAGAVSFVAEQAGADPAGSGIQVTNTGGGSLTGLDVSTVYGPGASGWLDAQLTGTTAPATLTLQPHTGTLAPGSYSATVRVSSGVASNSPQTATITFEVTAAPLIGLDRDVLTFTAAEGEDDPEGQAVQITNAGGGTLSGLDVTVAYEAGEPADWLLAELDAAAAPATLGVAPLIAGLAAGTYTATVSISGNALNTPQQVTVTLVVQPPAPLP